jgi:dihydrofolate synthase/folylpolyglutamate synthase
MNTYEVLLDKLYTLNIHHIKLGLDRCHAMNNALGNPAGQYPTIHVAGTNGKGSVSTKIAKGLELAGKRVGLFTSPHITCFRERIQINGQKISEEDVIRLLPEVFESAPEASFFEVTTLLAFKYFAEEKVDAAVIEVGLGGRLDATNIITPQLSIITSISKDHTQYLGDTLEKITREKAGIIKKGVPVVIGPTVSKEIVKEYLADGQELLTIEGAFESYHDENNAIACKVMQHLGLSAACVENALKAIPPCRFQEVAIDGVPVVFDVAHNTAGLEKLFALVAKKYPNCLVSVVCGFSKDKDVADCLKVVARSAYEIYFVRSTNGRGAELFFLKEMMQTIPFSDDRVFYHETISEGVSSLFNGRLTPDSVVVVCGTFFIMSDVLSIVSIDEFDVEVARRVDKDIKKHGTVKWKDAKRDLGL